MDTQFLKNIDIESSRKSQPWTYWQLDQFLPVNEFKNFQSELCSVQSNFLKREDDEADINFMFLPNLELAKFFLSSDFRSFLESMVQKKLTIYKKSLVQLRLMTPNSPEFPIHIDSQNEKSLVCLFYLSPDWEPGKGGELCLYNEEQANSLAATIAPTENRMVAFHSEDRHWHSVKKVSDWNRYSIVTEWIINEELT